MDNFGRDITITSFLINKYQKFSDLIISILFLIVDSTITRGIIVMNSKYINSFFSISIEFVIISEELNYDLYINSSGNILKDRFVKIFKKNNILEREDLLLFKEKYHQLYINENQRDLYLQSLAKSNTITPEQKTEIIKESAIKYLGKLFDHDIDLNTELLEDTIEGCRDAVDAMVDVIQDYNVVEVQNLIGDLSFHDFYTYDHSINVSMYCIAIYKALKPKSTKEQLTQVGIAGLLHDLGKIKIPTDVINNPGKLNQEDFNLIKKHPELGKELLNNQQCNCHNIDFETIERVIMEHHENFNGTGYPLQISGDDIHFFARIVAVADFFDALTTKRSYHEVVSTEEAIGIMSRSSGKKIDPTIFEVFVKNANKVVQKRFIQKEMDEDFDPCRPCNVLPLRPARASVIGSDFTKKDEQDEKTGSLIILYDKNKKKAG